MMIMIKVKQIVVIKKTMKQVRVVIIKKVLEVIVIMKGYKMIIVIIKNKVIVQKIIFMIVRERVLLATPGH